MSKEINNDPGNRGKKSIEPLIIPREILFGNPVKRSPRISPDGKKIAYLAPVNNILNIWVKTIGTDDDRVVTKDEKRNIRSYFWAYDNQHIFYLQDVGGNENWNLHEVDLKTGEIKNLTPYEKVQVRVLAFDKHFPNEMLIQMNKENIEAHDVYNLNLSTGNAEMVAKNTGNIAGWLADSNFKVRIAEASKEDGSYDILIRKDEKSPWEKLFTWNAEDATVSSVVGFSKDGKSLYLADSRDYNTCRLVRVNIETGKTQVMAEDPAYNVCHLMVNPDTCEIQAVSFYKDRDEWTILDEGIKSDFEALKKLDEGDFVISSRDNDDKTWIVAFSHDNGPRSNYVFDRKSKKGIFLFYNQPALKDYTLAHKEPICITSRDGLTLHGYITYPPGKGKKNLPVVLNVHGGPEIRDTWNYEADVQWLANRGYVCLQINFRGSAGYGKKFFYAGFREWGNKMHNDLVDGVNRAIKEGIADPKKIAIYGGSYGGYATLAGVTFTPDLFCCGVDLFGPSSLITLLRTMPPYKKVSSANMVKMLGDPDKDEDFLKSRSPLYKVDQIKVPLLIAQGANDPRVIQAESDQIVEEMKKRGLDYEYILFPDEGHGFVKQENRLKFYGIAEKFLAKHLGGRYQ